MNTPLVSVLMPVYNSERYVAEAIDSILSQDYTNFEKSGSTLSANANLSAKDKKDIAELERRLSDLKKS